MRIDYDTIKKIGGTSYLMSMIPELAEEILDIMVDCCPYDIDIYMHIEDDGNVWFERFANVDHNSWLESSVDFISKIYTVRETTNTLAEEVYYSCDYMDDLLAGCGLDKDKDSIFATMNDLGYETPDYDDFLDLVKYIEHEYTDTLTDFYREILIQSEDFNNLAKSALMKMCIKLYNESKESVEEEN